MITKLNFYKLNSFKLKTCLNIVKNAIFSLIRKNFQRFDIKNRVPNTISKKNLSNRDNC